MSAKQYTLMLKKAEVPASEITTIVNNVANMGKNERFSSSHAMNVIQKCIQDAAFRGLFIKQPIVACTQLGIKL